MIVIRRPGSGIGRDIRTGGAHLAVGGNNLDPGSVATQIGNPAGGKNRRRQFDAGAACDGNDRAGGDVNPVELVRSAHLIRRKQFGPVGPCVFRRHAVGHDALAVSRPSGTAAEVPVLRNTPKPRAVGVNEIDVDQLEPLPTAFRGGKAAVAVRREGDPAAIGRPRRPEIATPPCGQRPRFAGGEVQDPKIRKTRGPRRYKCDLPPIGRECGLIVVGRIGGQAFDIAAVGTHAEEIGGAFPFRRKYDPIAPGRPRGIVIERAWLRERPLRGAIGVRDKKGGLGWA